MCMYVYIHVLYNVYLWFLVYFVLDLGREFLFSYPIYWDNVLCVYTQNAVELFIIIASIRIREACNSQSYVVIGVEHSSDVLCQIAIQDSLYVVPMVDWKRGKRGTLYTMYFIVLRTVYIHTQSLVPGPI